MTVSSPVSEDVADAADAPRHSAAHAAQPSTMGRTLKLALGAIGVVYGDIGTSPLYAVKECVATAHGAAPAPGDVLGVLSLIFWSLTLVVSIKYLLFVMRADNDGEGGVLALLALVVGPGAAVSSPRRRMILVMLGLFGAALLYGDGVITPAISVLSAVEGLVVVAPAFSQYVVPLTCVILVGLFMAQRGGTARIGAVFGPVTLCWFLAIAAAGLPFIVRHPAVLWAANPVFALRYFVAHGRATFLVLGSVVLCVTGGEALYADMGHFGTRAIRTAWAAVVFPALLINYFGQGALLLERPQAVDNPFFALVPPAFLLPMVFLATAATVVASQALISGAFSLTRQAVQLGYLPRMTIIHTSGKTEGQIYIPEINWLLAFGCVALVLGFRASSDLAAAYGIAVTGTMAITSVLFYFVARGRWGWSRLRAGTLLGVFLGFDLAFFAACTAKIAHGGWVPVLLATGVFIVMLTWKRGRTLLGERFAAEAISLGMFVADVEMSHPHRVTGTAVFLTSLGRGTPNVLLHHYKHNHMLHAQVVILSIVTDPVPEVPPEDSVRLKSFGQGFWAVTAHYGFMQSPDILEVLRSCRVRGLGLDEANTSFFLGRETILSVRKGGMAAWRKRLFCFLSRNSRSASDFFALPANRVVEIGTQIEL